MRGYELNVNGHVMEQTAPISEQPLAHPEMQVQPSPILQYMMEDRMMKAMLFSKNRTFQKHDPFALPQLPDEVRPQFDIGGGI